MLKKNQLYNFIKSIKTVIIYTNLPHTYKYLDNKIENICVPSF